LNSPLENKKENKPDLRHLKKDISPDIQKLLSFLPRYKFVFFIKNKMNEQDAASFFFPRIGTPDLAVHFQ
jgi:hypothetical protein